MKCVKCDGDMYKEEFCINTMQADIDDSYDEMWVCDDCGNTFTF